MTWVDVLGYIIGGLFVAAFIGAYFEDFRKDRKK